MIDKEKDGYAQQRETVEVTYRTDSAEVAYLFSNCNINKNHCQGGYKSEC